MLPKQNRLNLKKDFKWIASGKKIETKFAKLFIKTGGNALPRVGIAVSAKVFKKATERSRAKRLMSQAFQSAISQLPPDVNIVALPKHGVLDVKSDEVFKDLEQALSKEHIISL